MEPQPSQPAAQPQRRRPTAVEVRKSHGIYAVITMALLIWFVRDGWFNAEPKMQEHLLFNRSGSVICGVLALFFLTMAASAHFTVRRQQQQSRPQPETSSSPTPPS